MYEIKNVIIKKKFEHREFSQMFQWSSLQGRIDILASEIGCIAMQMEKNFREIISRIIYEQVFLYII